MKEERRNWLNWILAIMGAFFTATVIGGNTASIFLEVILKAGSRMQPSLIILPGFYDRWLFASHLLASAIGAAICLISIAVIQFHPIERLKRHVKLVRTVVPEKHPAAQS